MMPEFPDTLYVQTFTVLDVPVFVAVAEPREGKEYTTYVKDDNRDLSNLWQMAVVQDKKEDEAAFMVNWLKGTIKIPEAVKQRIISTESCVSEETIEEFSTALERDIKKALSNYETHKFGHDPMSDEIFQYLRALVK